MDTSGTLFMPPGGSTIAGEVDALFYLILYIALFFLVVVTGAALYFVLKYRRRQKVGLTSGVAHNIKLELAWTIIPTILVIIIFVFGFKIFIKMNVVPKDALEIKVTAQRWMWIFDYPQGLNSSNELVVPVGKPIKLLMSSNDVIHSFFVPGFRIKMDVLPNRYTITWFEATSTGEFDLFCAEYCGKGHSEMIGKVRVVNAREYDEWLNSMAVAGEGIPLEELGRKLYKSRACNTCHTIDGTASVGPSFKGLFGHRVYFADGEETTASENYIRESILEPRARIVAGFQAVMPTYQGILKGRDVDALIAYIKSLEKEED